MIDYSFWDRAQEYTLDQAAWLWLDIEPKLNDSERTQQFLSVSDMLYNAIKTGSLQGKDTAGSLNGVFNWGETYIKREHLKQWAERSENKGYKPKFLFPEMRMNSETNQDNDLTRYQKINSPEHKKLLEAIEAFPVKFPQYSHKNPPLDGEIKPWLAKTFGFTEAEKTVFGRIIAEHYGINIKRK